MTKAEAKRRQKELDARIAKAQKMSNADCECWEGCNDREGKLPCVHDILWEGVKLWAKEFPTPEKAEYQ